MKRMLPVALAMVLLLLSFSVPALAALSKEEVGAVVERIYAAHQERHTFYTYTNDGSGSDVYQAFICTADAPKTLLGCAEQVTGKKSKLPSNGDGISKFVQSILEMGIGITHSNENVFTYNQQLSEVDYANDARMAIPSMSMWVKGKMGADTELYVGPIVFQNKKGDVLDDSVYIVCIFSELESTRVWLLTDLDLVRDMLVGLGVQNKGDGKNAAFAKQWVEDLQGYDPLAAPQTEREPFGSLTDLASAAGTGVAPRGPDAVLAAKAAEAAALAAEEAEKMAAILAEEQARAEAIARLAVMPTLGTVIIKNESGTTVNLRESDTTDSGIAGRVYNDMEFRCVGVTESGWYEIVYETTTAYVSSKLSVLVGEDGEEIVNES